MAAHRVPRAGCTTLVLVLWTVVGAPARGQDAVDDPSAAAAGQPRFLIESIAVEGTQRDSVRRIVVGQSRLEPGREYGERELSEAVRRVKRLPFVLDARPLLRRGSAPGAYVLALLIEENARVYLAARASLTDPMDRGAASGQLGLEHFVGGDELLLASLDGFKSFDGGEARQARVGYMKFDVFGPATLLSFDLGTASGRGLDGWWGGAALVVPTGGNHSLQARLDVSRHPVATTAGATWAVSPAVNWIFDTTDDPFAPISGRRYLARLDYTRTFGQRVPDWAPNLDSMDAGGSLVFFRPVVGPLGAAPGLGASCQLRGGSGCYVSGSMALRLVGATRGNRERMYAALRLSGSTEAFEPGADFHWFGDLSIGFRSKWAVIVIGFWWSA